MKKALNFKVLAIILAVITVSMAACGGDLYDDLADEGYSVKVIFDPSGAWVHNREGVTIVEVYDPDNVVTNAEGKTGIPLLAPTDSRRGNKTFRLSMTDESSNSCYDVGWYTHRELRVGENGEPLDAYGVPTSQSKRAQGYIYSGRWDFENDVITEDMINENGEFVLYAAMVPCFTYKFYEQGENGEFEIISSATVRKRTLVYPFEETFAEILSDDGKVLKAAYLDEELTQELTGNYDGALYYVDYESGTLTQTVINIYLVWED